MKASNVSTGKPKKGGAIFVAPLGTALPTDATTALAETYVEVGYASGDGITNTRSIESEEIKAWGGDIVLRPQTSVTDEWKFTLIEALNENALKVVYGDDNVTGTLSEGITITSNSDEPTEHVIVIDMLLKNAVKRIVLPQAKVSEVGDITYTDSDAIGYETTLACTPDDSGNTHYEYIKAA